MTLKNNKKLNITLGANRRATQWAGTEMMLSEFIVRLQTPVRSPETYDEYLALPKMKQDDLKDVGGFVGGTFEGTRRKANAVTGRDLVTLDMDNIPAGGTPNVLRRVGSLGCFAVVYSTRKHHEATPRLRVVIPLDTTAEPDEYEPVARKLASQIGIEYCDPTTFEASRLMYWPSVSNGAQYVCEIFDRPFCKKFDVLMLYTDWTDVTQWPRVPGENENERRRLTKAEDPLTKKGIVGAFCRTYTVTQAMAKFLPGVYESTDIPNRLTYAGGSTTGGAVLYGDDRFLYSHHATDPISGMLVNAWDLVRVHKYGDRDDAVPTSTPASAMPSFKAMQDLATQDEAVLSVLAQERHVAAQDVFGDVVSAPAAQETSAEEINWMTKLAVDQNGNFEKTIDNIILILTNDPMLAGKIATDDFSGLLAVSDRLPWDSKPFIETRRWNDEDDAGLHWYLEKVYRLKAKDATDDAIKIASGKQRINTVRSFLQGLKWDGVARLDTLFIDYLGAEDNPYTRAVARKTLCAACARAVHESVNGVKFDYMPILIGGQGIGKSTLVRYIGKQWFSDSLVTFEGKEAAEMLQGTWVNEIGELAAMTKYETDAVKQFLSKTTDIYRPSYGRVTKEYPRRCVFIGTSNHMNVLKDVTGNRRFWPIDTEVGPKSKDIWRDLPVEVDQIWAEAFFRFQWGESLYMNGDLESYANNVQRAHEEDDDWTGLIEDFLNQNIPKNWDNMTLTARRQYLSGNFDTDEELVPRDKVCAREIYYECLGRTDATSDPRLMKRINGIMTRMRGWVKNKTTRRYGPHGAQRGYEKVWTYQGGGEWA